MNTPAPAKLSPRHIDDQLQLPGDPPSARRNGRWALAIVALIAGVLVAKQWVGPRPAMAAWNSDWDQSLAQSAKTGRPMLVMFTADWCGACDRVKKDLLSDDEIAAYLRDNFELVKIDLTQRGGPNDRLAQVYRIRGVPTFLVFSARGNLVSTLAGAGDRGMMNTWFRATAVKAR